MRFRYNDIFDDTTYSCRFGLYIFPCILVSDESGGDYAGLYLCARAGSLCVGDGWASVMDRWDCGTGDSVNWHLAGEQAAGAAKRIWQNMPAQYDRIVISYGGVSVGSGSAVYIGQSRNLVG